jgi:hypothetical protein
MTQRYLRHKLNGHVVIYQDHLLSDSNLEECADAAGTPMNVHEGEFSVVEEPKKPKAKKAGLSKPVDDLDLDDIDAKLSADASRGL